MDFSIKRQTEPSEALSEAFAHLMPQLSPRLGAPGKEAVERLLKSPSAALFTAEEGERILGMLTLVCYDVPSGRKAWIEDVVVDEAARGRGIGRSLVEAALTCAGEQGVEKLMLTSSERRKAAHALYRRMGFEVAETTLFVHKPIK